MVDANFNKEKGRQVVLIGEYLKHCSGAGLVTLFLMLKTQTEERSKNLFPKAGLIDPISDVRKIIKIALRKTLKNELK